MLNSNNFKDPFFDRRFQEALLALDSKEKDFKLYKQSLNTLMIKESEGVLFPVGDRNYVDYRALSDGDVDIIDLFQQSQYKKIIIDSVKFSEIEKIHQKLQDSILSVKIKKKDISVKLDLPESYKGYIDGLDRKNRHELKRKLNKFNKQFSEHRVTNGKTDSHFSSFINLHKNSSEAKMKFMTEDVEELFYNILQIDGWSIYQLEVEENPVASCFCYSDNEIFYLYNSGKNKKYDDFSVGIFLINELITVAIDSNLKIFDFLKGTERYKFNLGGEPQQLFDIEISKI
ncbi:MAG: GNAT family N-acetyltransferase [Actinomycetota bacterium]|nr:GNAT family N-acetyltransferase [Actinomycetota bacterium]